PASEQHAATAVELDAQASARDAQQAASARDAQAAVLAPDAQAAWAREHDDLRRAMAFTAEGSPWPISGRDWACISLPLPPWCSLAPLPGGLAVGRAPSTRARRRRHGSPPPAFSADPSRRLAAQMGFPGPAAPPPSPISPS